MLLDRGLSGQKVARKVRRDDATPRRLKNDVEMSWTPPQMDIQAIFTSSLTPTWLYGNVQTHRLSYSLVFYRAPPPSHDVLATSLCSKTWNLIFLERSPPYFYSVLNELEIFFWIIMGVRTPIIPHLVATNPPFLRFGWTQMGGVNNCTPYISPLRSKLTSSIQILFVVLPWLCCAMVLTTYKCMCQRKPILLKRNHAITRFLPHANF